MSREYNIRPAQNPARTGDVCHYASGKPYVVTDHGPNIWTTCYLCNAPAAATPERPMSTVRCGQCLLDEFEMQPGQRVFELKAERARQSVSSRRRAQTSSRSGASARQPH